MKAMELIYVAMGGAVGSMCRYALSSWIAKYNSTSFPYPTFIINIGGSFLLGIWIGFIILVLAGRTKELHLLMAIGMLGGFTTFSTFSFESYMLMEKGLWLQACYYIIGSVGLSIVAFIAGMWILRTLHA